MTVTVVFYKSAKMLIGGANCDLDLVGSTQDFRAIALTNAYSINQAHDFVNDLTNEVTVNIVSSRIALAGETFALSGNNARVDCDDIAFRASGGSMTMRQFALSDYTGSSGDSDRDLLALFTNDSDLVPGDGTDALWQTPSGLFEIQ